MSTVYGRKIGTDSTLGVKCDICGEIYWTDLTGQSFPGHVREAVQHGWKNTNEKKLQPLIQLSKTPKEASYHEEI